MALIKSTILAQMSGSVNGITFARNAGGAYMRNRSLVSNPATDRQDQVRTAMTSLSKMWANSLSDSDREAWRLYGAAVTVINRIGDPIKLSGIAAFIRVNLFRIASLGIGAVTAVPEYETGSGDAIPSFVSSVINYGTGPAALSVTLNSTGAGYGMFMYFSGKLSPGIKFFKGPYSSKQTSSNSVSPDTFIGPLPAGFALGDYAAAKVILYNSTTYLKVWEIYLDPTVIVA